MAILKFLNDPADFAVITGNRTNNSAYFDSQRISGWFFTVDDSFQAITPAPVGDEWWFHGIISYSNSNIGWDENEYFRIEDGNGNLVISSDIRDGFIDWNVIGGTTQALNYRTIADAQLMIDIRLVADTVGETLEMTVWVNGAFQGTRTVTNAGNVRGLPQNITLTNLDSASGGTIYFGEALVADEDTRGWRLYQLAPTAFGVNQEWDGEASSVVDGSLLTGISTDVVNERASFGVTNIENISDDALIDRIAIQTYGQRGESGLTAFNHYFRYENGTIIDDTDNLLQQTVGLFIDEYENNPNTATAWTAPDIQGLQIGVRGRS